MEAVKHPFARRAAAAALALLFALAALALFAPKAYADSGDLDEIQNYRVDVTPDTDGSLAIVVTVDWLVLDSTSEGPLEWVQIGVPNEAAENFTALTDTISNVYRDGEYAHITFDRSYSAGEVVHFSYSWTQPYMYTLGEDGSVRYDYTPGWFDNANVDSMQLTWHYNGVAPSGINASATGKSDGQELDDAFVLSSRETLAHSDTMTVSMEYASWPATLDAGMSADNYSSSDYDSGSGDDSDLVVGFFVLIFVIFFMVMVISSAGSWVGGFYYRNVPHYRRRGGLYYDCDWHGTVPPGAVGRAAPPPGARAFTSMGGGRSGGGCACASSCACACACAGGGRAGCSAKNLYGAVHLPALHQVSGAADTKEHPDSQ